MTRDKATKEIVDREEKITIWSKIKQLWWARDIAMWMDAYQRGFW